MTSKIIPDLVNGYQTNKFLGKGAFSYVYECSKDDKVYALKRINSEERFLKYAKREIEYLKIVDCVNIIRMVDNFMDNNIQYLVLECLEENLYRFIFKQQNYPNFDEFSSYCYQLVNGLEYLHDNDIVHCDLKLENVMIANDLKNIKIIDLGSSFRKDVDMSRNYYIQSRYYRAPEILYQINFSPKIDIWSLGILITELIFRKCLFNGRDTYDMIYKITDYFDIPYIEEYWSTPTFKKLFNIRSNSFNYTQEATNYKIKGYREDRFNEYLVKAFKAYFPDIHSYQIDNTITLLGKILDYDYINRISSKDLKNELLILEGSE